MIISIAIMVVFILADFFIKQFFVSIFQVNEMKTIIEGVLEFGYVRNYGASFGILQGESLLFFFITLVALVLFGYFFSKSDIKNKKVYTFSFIFLISGTLGNGIDRLLFGYVIDYIQIPFLPIVGNTIFNLADVILIAGVVLLCIDVLILDTIKNKKNKTIETETHE